MSEHGVDCVDVMVRRVRDLGRIISDQGKCARISHNTSNCGVEHADVRNTGSMSSRGVYLQREQKIESDLRSGADDGMLLATAFRISGGMCNVNFRTCPSCGPIKWRRGSHLLSQD